MIQPGYFETKGGIYFKDPDTVRRLARLERDRAESYPSPDARDGWPDGSAIHWTLPMDWVIQVLDAVVPSVHANAKPNESGAAWAGPVLATLATIAFTLLALCWGTAIGMFSGVLYALSTPLIEISSIGNGDHQGLQHLLVVVAVLGTLASIEGKAGMRVAILAGASLGASLWVSTESMVVLVVLASALGVHNGLATREERAARWQRDLAWAVTCLGACIVADRLENPSRWAFEWDRISGFQIVLALIPVVYLLVARELDARMPKREQVNTWIAGAASLVAIGLVFVVVPPFGRAFAAEVESLGAANRWTQTCVREYQGLFALPFGAPGMSFAFAAHAFTVLFYVTPVLIAGLLVRPDRSWALRAPLALIAASFLLLTIYELKLAHLFSVVYPLLILFGSLGFAVLARPSGELQAKVLPAVGVVTVIVFLLSAPLEPKSESQQGNDLAGNARRELVAKLRELDAGDSERKGVLGIWELGAHTMYYADKPVVASGYHRNLDGIRDAYRFLTSTSVAEASEILDRRKVRWVVRQGDPAFFLQVGPAFPEIGSFGVIDIAGVRIDPRASTTAWNQLANPDGAWKTKLKRVWKSSIQARWFGAFPGPAFMIYEVVDR